LVSKPERTNKEILLRLISLCDVVERKGINPFEVEVKEALESIRQLLSKWKSFEEFCLDAEAINRLSKVVKLQEEWVQHKSSLLYSDPEMVESKIAKLNVESLAEIFLKAWHPIVGLEKLSAERLKEALMYWNSFSPKKFDLEELSFRSEEVSGFTSKEELLNLKILVKEEFNRILEDFWNELLRETKGREKISYWNFVFAENYEEFVLRAYLTSFLVSYGYVDIETNPLEEEIFIVPRSKPKKPELQKRSTSLVVPLNYSRWVRLKEQKQVE